jgi:hypothetical protein
LQGLRLTKLHISHNPEIKQLAPLKGMPLNALIIERCTRITDLELLREMPLTVLNINYCTQFDDLTILKGKPLTHLEMFDTGVTDLTPLAGMPLDLLFFTPRKITRGMDVLNPRNMPTLRRLKIGMDEWAKPAEFWRQYEAGEFK